MEPSRRLEQRLSARSRSNSRDRGTVGFAPRARGRLPTARTVGLLHQVITEDCVSARGAEQSQHCGTRRRRGSRSARPRITPGQGLLARSAATSAFPALRSIEEPDRDCPPGRAESAAASRLGSRRYRNATSEQHSGPDVRLSGRAGAPPEDSGRSRLPPWTTELAERALEVQTRLRIATGCICQRRALHF